MVKRLSDQLSDLSVRAKNLETAVAAAQKEGHDKVVARTAEARASATASVDKVKQSVKAARDAGSTKWGRNGSKTRRRHGRVEDARLREEARD